MQKRWSYTAHQFSGMDKCCGRLWGLHCWNVSVVNSRLMKFVSKMTFSWKQLKLFWFFFSSSCQDKKAFCCFQEQRIIRIDSQTSYLCSNHSVRSFRWCLTYGIFFQRLHVKVDKYEQQLQYDVRLYLEEVKSATVCLKSLISKTREAVVGVLLLIPGFSVFVCFSVFGKDGSHRQ